MDFMVLLGFFVAGISVYFGFPEIRSSFYLYFDPRHFLLILGGTMAATIISTSFKDFKNILSVFWNLIFPNKKLKPIEAVKLIVKIAGEAQCLNKQEYPSLLPKKVGDGFLNRGLTLIASGLDREFIKKVLETDIEETQRRHFLLIITVRTMGSYASMFGMVGTILGVVQVLRNISNVNMIVAGMSLALLTTLYGLLLSSLVFIPISNKLKTISEHENIMKEIMKEGILALMDKEIPLKVEHYLLAYLESKYKNSNAKK